ncbi:hypothetical protein CUJ83_08710 [Methanocella sp. CWC-04]|uniref:Uncharacterized protein n=1 Tax=Methanooceanicella nereidis TaxID=2052831 RepID=A0AAP2W6A6_9EURY|nr:hypothetical protein [Methanocella sp. CWC-04]MCD1295077.1 hypothetical protein [Methanocella sp. CWC-04]
MFKILGKNVDRIIRIDGVVPIYDNGDLIGYRDVAYSYLIYDKKENFDEIKLTDGEQYENMRWDYRGDNGNSFFGKDKVKDMLVDIQDKIAAGYRMEINQS